MKKFILIIGTMFLLSACSQAVNPTASGAQGYFDNSGRDDALSGGVKLIPVHTVAGDFHVWTKRTGNHPRIKVLLLHGGPGTTHEYLEAFDSYLPAAGIEYYYYDQLGSTYSDQPDAPQLWEIPRFVEEVEQVRLALGLDHDNFYLYGHSWGGILAIEYALEHQQHLKGLIISNMMSSIPAYNAYARDVLEPAMDQNALAKIKAFEAAGKYDDQQYMDLLMEHFYRQHFLRMPPDLWPDPVKRAFAHLNPKIYIPMQGPSELGASGKILHWERTANLPRITVPTLIIAARNDTMDPKYLEMMATKVRKGRYLLCPNGSHLAMFDDQQIYMKGVIEFIQAVDAGRF
ncbi:MAG: proline iminopeptidase-family hydrolase [Desulfobacteraceae bacterium]|nr:proline iminopeptidase-family hydrolase [Desulfobacteraceae bacterium]